MHCCVCTNFGIIVILLAFGNEIILALHVTIVNHWAWKKRPSYFSLE
jgi:hypothetical protein